jgi:hypothetical protein
LQNSSESTDDNLKSLSSIFDLFSSKNGGAFSDLLGSGSPVGGAGGLGQMNSSLSEYIGGAGTLSGSSGLFTSQSGNTGMGVGDSLYTGTGSVVGSNAGRGAFDSQMMDTSWLDDISSSISTTFTDLFGDTGSLTKMFDGFGTNIMDMFGSIGDFFGSSGGGGEALSGIGNWFGSLSFADGGLTGKITGPGTSRSDSIPAMLSNGEFIVNAKSTKENLKLLTSINSGRIKKLAQGGLADNINMPSIAPIDSSKMMNTPKNLEPIKSTIGKSGSNQTINLSITGDISRQTQAEIYKMLPVIANGVNMQNKEKGYKG